MFTGRGSNQGPLGPKSDALTTAPLRHLHFQKAGFSHDQTRIVFFFHFSQVQITEDVRQYLRKPTFDNWQWDEPEMLVLLQQMYIDLGFVTKFKIEVGTVISHICMFFISSLEPKAHKVSL